MQLEVVDVANGDIPAGWYPEPSGAGGERWWDGYQWTEHVRATQPAERSATPAPQAQVPAGWYPDPSGGGGQRYWDGAQWTDHVDPPATTGEPQPAEQQVTEAPADAEGADEAAGAGEVADAAPLDDASVEAAASAERSTTEIPAGWYPDPAGAGGQRWWDGTQWTDHLQDVAASSTSEGAGTSTGLAAGAAGAAAAAGTAAAGTSGAAAAEADGSDGALDDPGPVSDVTAPLEGDARSTSAADDPEADVTAPLEHDTGGAQDAGALSGGDASGGQATGPAGGHEDAGAAVAATIPPGWYPDPSGDGERWWSGDAWTEHVRSSAPQGGPADVQATQAYAPVDDAQQTQAMDAVAQAPGQPAASQQAGDQGFTMAGVGDVPPSGPAPQGEDDGGGGSGKLILVIVLVVVLLAAIGAGVWFLTDVFGDDVEPAAATGEEEVVDEAPEEETEVEESEPEPEPEPTFEHIDEVDLSDVERSSSCLGSYDPVIFTVQYGDVTGDGTDDAVLETTCDADGVTHVGFEVWSLDAEGQPVQQPAPPVEHTVGEVDLVGFEVGDGRLTVVTSEIQPDQSGLEVTTEYTLSGGSWAANELEREEPPAAIEDDQIPGISHVDFSDDWDYEARPTHQAPLIATHTDEPVTFIIALDESLLGASGGLDLDELSDEWVEVLEALADEEEVTLEDGWISEVDVAGADRAVMLLYDGETADINYYVLLVEVADVVVEVSVQMGQEGWSQDQDLRGETVGLFESFAFDADTFMATYGQG